MYAIRSYYEQRGVACNGVCREVLGLDGGAMQGGRLDGVVKLGHLTTLMTKGYCFRSQPVSVGTGKLICHYVPRVEDGVLKGGVLAIDKELRAPDDLSYIELQEIVSYNFV